MVVLAGSSWLRWQDLPKILRLANGFDSPPQYRWTVLILFDIEHDGLLAHQPFNVTETKLVGSCLGHNPRKFIWQQTTWRPSKLIRHKDEFNRCVCFLIYLLCHPPEQQREGRATATLELYGVEVPRELVPHL